MIFGTTLDIFNTGPCKMRNYQQAANGNVMKGMYKNTNIYVSMCISTPTSQWRSLCVIFSLLPAFSMSGNRHQAASFRQEGHVHSLTFFSANPLAKVMPSITQNFSETRIWFALGGVDHTKLCVRKIWLAIGAPSPPKSDFDAAKLWRSANFSMRLARAVYWTLLVFSAVLAANL